MTDKIYRNLTESECRCLESQNCHSTDWNMIKVSGGFEVSQIRNCTFRGEVLLSGAVSISNVGVISNCEIAEGAEIWNTAVIECIGESSFGCGTEVAVINENGGRKVPLFPTLTSQLAYMTAIYRHREHTVKKLYEIFAKEYTKGSRCRIEKGVKIIGCGILRNIRIGADAVLEGVSRLENGTVFCHAGQNTYIGTDVRLKDFVISGNSRVDNGTTGERCFFGNGSHVSSASCTDSMFFAGSDCENGEFCSVLAGPYTASHHKSTLLIAGMFSFFNAGSGTNFSNHLLKSGPVHQGIHQRGCKYGSGSYMMLPALDGAFTTVIGHHRNHPDTESFPYSLLLEREGQSWLIPAANLSAVGIRRDLHKWPLRDKRDKHSADIINFVECNPYIAERIERALKTIDQLNSSDPGDTIVHKGLRIRNSMLKRGARLYGLAMQKQIGGMLSKGAVPVTEGTGSWTDVAGMYIPIAVMQGILDRIDSGELATAEEITRSLSDAHAMYDSYASGWAYDKLRRDTGREPSPEDIRQAVVQGEIAAAKLDALADEDLRAETDISMSAGYGLESDDDAVRAADFKYVRKL